MNRGLRKISGRPQEVQRHFTATVTAAIPTPGGLATLNHGFTVRPTTVRLVLECLSAEKGYTVGEEVDLMTVVGGQNGGSYFTGGYIEFAGTSCWGIRHAVGVTKIRRGTGFSGSSGNSNLYTLNETSGAVGTAIDPTKWQLKGYFYAYV